MELVKRENVTVASWRQSKSRFAKQDGTMQRRCVAQAMA